jgi:nuclear GTP-binding protein
MGVLMDWRDGRIRGWVDAPKEVENGESAGSREIVREWAEEFKLEGLWGDDGGEGVDVMKE